MEGHILFDDHCMIVNFASVVAYSYMIDVQLHL